MKAPSLILTGLVLAAGVGLLAWWILPAAAPPAPQAQLDGPPPTTIQSEPADVFQKAFWKRPTVADKILHAERREWADATGIKRWQWFLVVEPSAALVKHLREENAFGLAAGIAGPPPAGAPAWFSYQPPDMELLGHPRHGMQLLFAKSGGLLYATSSGGGFAPGAPGPIATASPAPQPATGRLPLTAPPLPSPSQTP